MLPVPLNDVHKGAPLSLVSLELGHITGPRRLVPLHNGTTDLTTIQFDQKVLAEVRQQVEKIEANVRVRCGIPASRKVERIGLYDDIIVHDRATHSDDSARWAIFSHISRESLRQGTHAELVRNESEFVFRGKHLLDEIVSRAGKLGVEPDSQGHILLPTNHGSLEAKIFGFRGISDPDHPSCAVLDLAWTAWRAQQYRQVVTVLPENYLAQQKQVAALASLMGMPWRGQVTSIFFDPTMTRITHEMNFASLYIMESQKLHPEMAECLSSRR